MIFIRPFVTMKFSVAVALSALLLPSLTIAVSSTDEYQDADTAQSGYLPNHNIDPSTLGSYGHAWTNTFNAQEGFLAKPLTYTPNGYANELVIVVSNQNIVRVIDGVSGQVLNARTLDPPFQATDSMCGDISPTIGITGTPIIDPATDTMYFFSKGYKNGATGSGTLNGQYKFYAVKIPTLTDVAGFPIIIDGHYANNDNTRYFVGGTLLNRPGLAMIGNIVVGGFGGHCDNFNYTGMLVSVSKTTATVTNIQAMVAAPGAPSPQPTNYMQQTGGKAGIWQGGMGLAVHGNNVYFSTGNGVGPGINKVQGVPASGKTYSSTLEQVAACFAVDPNTGALTQQDYFEPYNFDTQLNGGDRDMASAGVALLDRNTFNAPSVGVNGIAVASGKNGVVYIMNADNLGGFYNGGANKDATLQQIATSSGSFYGGVGSYPLEGGYLYFCPTGGPLFAYSYGLDSNGNPQFTLAGTGPSGMSCIGNPTITSLNGKAGTGVVWLADVNVGLVAFNAIPVGGNLVPITLGWASGRLNKYQRPVFGNARVYTSENNMIYAVAPNGKAATTSKSAVASSTVSTSTKITVSTSAISTSTKATSVSVSSSTSVSVSSVSSFSSTSTASSSVSSVSSSSSSTLSSVSSVSSSAPSTLSSALSISSSVSSVPLVSSVSSSSSFLSSVSTSVSVSSFTRVTTSTTMSTSIIRFSSTISVSATGSSTSKTFSTATPTAASVLAKNPAIKTRTYNWNIGWVQAAPDGFSRPFVGINGQWPCPPIVANIGDIIKINVVNGLVNETTSIHFHGIFQQNTTFEDGAAGVTQCPIAPGQTLVYQFTVLQSGTYWYHAHVGGQYIDGFRGPLIFRDNLALAPYGTIDQEVTLTLSDVYHVEAPFLINYFLSPNNYNGAEPVPDSALINEAQNVIIPITPGKTYMFHIINTGALAAQYIQFGGHNMTIIEADGTWTQPYTVNQLFVAVAQRYTVLVKALPTNTKNFAIVSQFMADMFDSSVTPAGQQATCTGWLVYNPSLALPDPFVLQAQPWNDLVLVPRDQAPLWDSNNVQYVYVTVDFAQNDQGSTRAMVNGLTYLSQKVPTLYTALTAPAQYLSNPTIYGQINPFILPFSAVIELSISNHDGRAHPFHLHGHQFQVLSRAANGDLFPGLDSPAAAPLRRDTLVVYPGTGATVRFVTDNPGIWLFHCHTEFHVEAGMVATFIEAPDVMVARKPYVPVSHRDSCDQQGISRKGNAGGNFINWTDLSNANVEPNLNYYGALITPPASNPYTGPA